jgi:hypothetical protein
VDAAVFLEENNFEGRDIAVVLRRPITGSGLAFRKAVALGWLLGRKHQSL